MATTTEPVACPEPDIMWGLDLEAMAEFEELQRSLDEELAELESFKMKSEELDDDTIHSELELPTSYIEGTTPYTLHPFLPDIDHLETESTTSPMSPLRTDSCELRTDSCEMRTDSTWDVGEDLLSVLLQEEDPLSKVLSQFAEPPLSDSPPPSPDPPPPLKHAAMDEETTDEDISPPASLPPSYSSATGPDLDYYPTKYSSPKAYPKSPKPLRPGFGSASFGRNEPSFGRNERSAFHKYPGSMSRGTERSSLLEAYNSGYEGYITPEPITSPARLLEDQLNNRDTLLRDRVMSDSSKQRGGSMLRRDKLHELSGSQLSGLTSPPAYNALSPPPCPQSRGYASSMPFLDHDEKRADRMDTLGGRSYSPLSECSRTTNASRLSLAKKAIANSHHQHIDNQSAGSSVSSDPDLHEIIQILSTSSNPSLVSSAAGCIQHLAYNHDNMKARIREAGAIPILVQLLTNDSVCTAALGALRNLSFGRQNTENKIAIQDAHGIPLLVQLLKTSDVYEIQELVTGVFWNLSSSEHLKLTILRLAMEALVKNIIIPQSGWSSTRSDHIYNNIEWTTVFRNATGCLRNLSSAGLEGRKAMRSCPGLVDALLYTLRAVQGKNDVDNKAVENAVCILRNLSYRLESEVTAEQKYGQVEDWRNKGLGGGTFRQKGEENVSKRKKQAKKQKGKENASPMPEHTTGVGLLWQPTVVRTYLDLLLECSNPETLEGAVGALQNLTAPSWQPAEAIRETVRKEKGLSVITSLLRMPNDTVVRATAICLRNLALDIKNKDLLGRNAMHDLVKRLPGGDGSDGMTDVTIAAVICALNEVILTSSENCKVLKDTGGVARLVQVARSQDIYPIQCVIMSNEMLVRCWEFKELKRCIKQQGWTLQLYRQMPGMIDKSDGLEYDESKNQFNASYNSGLDRHSRRDIRQQQEEDHIDHSSSHHNMRAATLGRSFDPSLEYHRPERPTDKGQSLPARGYKEQYGVSDSWV